MSDETSSEQTNPAIKHGQGVLQRVEQRKQELTTRLAHIESFEAAKRNHSGGTAIEEALAAVAGMLTGDLNNIVEPTATQLNQWLETSRNLCEDKAGADAKVEAKAADAREVDAKAVAAKGVEDRVLKAKEAGDAKVAADAGVAMDVMMAAEAKAAEKTD